MSFRYFFCLCSKATFGSSRPPGGVYLWVADPRQVTFLCAAEEKSPKERPPRMAQPNPALLRLWGPRRSYAASPPSLARHFSPGTPRPRHPWRGARRRGRTPEGVGGSPPPPPPAAPPRPLARHFSPGTPRPRHPWRGARRRGHTLSVSANTPPRPFGALSQSPAVLGFAPSGDPKKPHTSTCASVALGVRRALGGAVSKTSGRYSVRR